jgi:hypothetical protein
MELPRRIRAISKNRAVAGKIHALGLLAPKRLGKSHGGALLASQCFKNSHAISLFRLAARRHLMPSIRGNALNEI